MKAFKIFAVVLGILALVYLVGPRVEFDPLVDPQVENLDIPLDSLDDYLREKNQRVENLKEGNGSRILWADSIRKTRYSIVYLHGFSASPMESFPVHVRLADSLGYNLYLPLLAGHGEDTEESFRELTPNALLQSAKEALAIGQLLGDDVIVMSCSTGSTLSLYLAAGNEELMDILVMYSPNIELHDPLAGLITKPWGTALVRAVMGEYRSSQADEVGDVAQYWTTRYHTNGLIALQSLIDQAMTEATFEAIEQPYYIGYYYKDDNHKDEVISVDAILDFDAHTSTPGGAKRLVAFPSAGAHVVANPWKSKASEEVFWSTFRYLKTMTKE